MEKIKEFILFISKYDLATKLLSALLLLVLGWVVINLVVKIVEKIFDKRDFDETLKPFVLNVILWLLRAALVVSVAGVVGIETTSFVAILGSIGLAIGMALQGALGNLAGGALILMFRPYKVGDLIESQGHLGVVKEIQLFTTMLLSPENRTIILPNGAVSNGDIVNYTLQGLIRVDCSVGISYSANIEKAKEVLLKVLHSDINVLKTPPPFVGVLDLGESSVDLAVRAYTTPDKYWDVFFRTNEQMKIALGNASIPIPFPQMDINLKK